MRSRVDFKVKLSMSTPNTTLNTVLSLLTSFVGAFSGDETADEVPETEERDKDPIKMVWAASYPSAVLLSTPNRKATFIRVKEQDARKRERDFEKEKDVGRVERLKRLDASQAYVEMS